MELNYRKYGEQGSHVHLPLIVMHGLLGMLDNWAGFARLWAEKGMVTYLIDLRNHGRSPHSPEMTYDSMAGDLLEFMLGHKITKANILGHSMGGKAAMLFACLHPQKVEKLIVADIAPRYYPLHHQEIFAALNALDLSALENRKQAEDFFLARLGKPSIAAFLLKSLYLDGGVYKWRFNLETLSETIGFLGEELTPSLKFSGPCLFLRGEKSDYITERDSWQIQTHFPDSRIVTVSGAGHWLHADNGAEFNRQILNFLV